ncbi:MAG: tetratricopeptide repeat protein [Candidatus Acidiferrales bacterium]
MSSEPIAARTASVCTVAVLLLLLGAPVLDLGAQSASAPTAGNSAIESHFAAAQKAQRDRDYATAEREYQQVIILAPNFAEVHMNLGLVYQLQSEPSKAMPEFLRALKIKPALVGANFFLGVDYCKMGEAGKAIPYLKAALQSEPDRLDTWLWLANAQEIASQIHSEVGTLDRALELQPNNVDALYLLGAAYERLGKQEVVHLEKVSPGSSRSEQLLAESYASSSEWPSAVIHFQNALAETPNRAGLHVELGEVFLHNAKVRNASQEFDEELRLDPGNLRALVRRGEARLIQRNVDGALEDWQQALAIDPQQTERILGIRETGFGDAALEQLRDANRESIQQLAGDIQSRNSGAARLALAFLAEQNGNSSQAETEANLAESLTLKSAAAAQNCSGAEVQQVLDRGQTSQVLPCVKKILTAQTSADLRIRLAGALLEAGEYDAAIRTLDGLQPADRNSAEASFWRARCYEKLATASYLHLYQADPGSYRLHELMGDLAAAKGDDAKAIEEYRGAIALKPSSPNLHYSLGHLLWKDLKIPEARAEFEAELALNPRHAGALDDMGDTYLLEHQPNKALPYLSQALAADSANSDIQRDLGTAYSELGDYRKAEEHFKMALVDDHDGAIHYKLARVYQALGEKENAAREFALSTELNRASHDKLEKQTQRLGEITKATEAP